MNNRNAGLLVLIAVVVAGALWYFRGDLLPATDELVVLPPTDSTMQDPAASGPRHPLPLPQAEPLAEEITPAAPLSDADFQVELLEYFGTDAGLVLANNNLIDKFVITVDNLTRAQVSERVRVAGQLPTEFIATEADTDGEFYLNPDNYARYDLYVDAVTSVEPETIAATYRRFYPQLQAAYKETGYPQGYFNDKMIETIDLLLLTPEPQGPILLTRPVVMYKFADPELEALSSGQKLLIRMGNDNAEKIKALLRSVRALIAPAQT